MLYQWVMHYQVLLVRTTFDTTSPLIVSGLSFSDKAVRKDEKIINKEEKLKPHVRDIDKQ